jgi:hypothetical protein
MSAEVVRSTPAVELTQVMHSKLRCWVGEVKHVSRIEVLPAYEWLLAQPAQ